MKTDFFISITETFGKAGSYYLRNSPPIEREKNAHRMSKKTAFIDFVADLEQDWVREGPEGPLAPEDLINDDPIGIEDLETLQKDRAARAKIKAESRGNTEEVLK